MHGALTAQTNTVTVLSPSAPSSMILKSRRSMLLLWDQTTPISLLRKILRKLRFGLIACRKEVGRALKYGRCRRMLSVCFTSSLGPYDSHVLNRDEVLRVSRRCVENTSRLDIGQLHLRPRLSPELHNGIRYRKQLLCKDTQRLPME
jgi:hypothetical protein